MNRTERKEWREWWQFNVRRFREVSLLTVWVLLVWAIEHFIVYPFPVNGVHRMAIMAAEVVFAAWGFMEVIWLLWFPYHSTIRRWWLAPTIEPYRLFTVTAPQ